MKASVTEGARKYLSWTLANSGRLTACLASAQRGPPCLQQLCADRCCRRRPMKRIVHTLPALVHFTALLALPFSQPQLHNLQVLADAICVAPNRKTLALLQRLSLDAPDPSNLADFLRLSPWDERDLRQVVTAFVIR